MINLEDLRQILELAREHELTELELESDGVKVRIRKEGTGGIESRPAPQPAATAPSHQVAPLPVAAPPPALDVDMELAVVKSPIVGTFYRAPDPNAPPFVEVGDVVRKGQTLCIVEAMKMMNNIDSEYDGTVVKVFVENGQPVQYGERLFAIKTK
jgi:acetyl-CoA carboxylase biotin carboxyl carrier protein